MKVYGQLEKAALEVLSSDPSQGVAGRTWFNSTSLKAKIDDGTNIRALLRNDQNCVFGNNGTAASNIRLNRAAAGVLQLVTGDDTTAEGSLSTSLAQLSSRLENYTTVGRPAFGNAGRLYFDTTSGGVVMDTGSAWQSIALTNPMTTGGDVIYGGASGTATRLANGSSGQVLTSAGGTSAPTWAYPGVPYVSQSSTLNPAAINTWYVLSGASFTITLPDASTTGYQGKSIVFQHAGTSLTQIYTFNTTSAQTMGGVASGSFAFYTNGEQVTFVSDGTNWQLRDRRTSTPWVSFVPTGSWVSNTTYTGMWRRVGDSMEFQVFAAITGTPTTAAFTFTLPGSMTIDTAKTLSTVVTTQNFGVGSGICGGSPRFFFSAYSSSTAIAGRYVGTGVVSGNLAIDQANPTTWVNTDKLFLSGTVPITGWQP